MSIQRLELMTIFVIQNRVSENCLSMHRKKITTGLVELAVVMAMATDKVSKTATKAFSNLI
jgi:hypothetical protein